MDMDEMRKRWAEYDRKLETNLRLNRQILNETYLGKTRTALQRLVAGIGVEMAVDIALLMALECFLYAHRALPQFLLPAAFLHLCVMVSLVTLARQIKIALEIDYSRPIATLQKDLERLRILRIRTMQAIFVLAPLLWLPLLIVTLKGLLGVDAYALFPLSWLIANVLFGMAVIPLVFWLSKRYRHRIARSRWIQRIKQDLAGESLNAAANFLTTLAEFEDETRDR
jgi:hypothetical protein